MYQEILYEVNDPVAVVTMNRPDHLNAFTERMLAELKHAFAAAEADERVVGIVLTGAGRGFCAGMDMGNLDAAASGEALGKQDYSALSADPGDKEMGGNFQVAFSYILSLKKPLIAAVNGPCAGLGFVFACLADMRFVERSAKITTSFSQRGLVAEHGSSWILPRLIGSGKALDLLWSARKIMGEEAYELGLCEKLYDEGQSVQGAVDYITHLSKVASPTAIRRMKAQVYRHLNMELGPAIEETNELMAVSLGEADFVEGVRSFVDRREPKFKRIGE